MKHEDRQQPSNYRVSVKAIIRNASGKILLIKEGDLEWGVPGGGLDHGETIEQGLRREIQEEVGAEMVSMSDLPLLAKPYCYEELGVWKLWLVYEVTLANEPTVGVHSRAIGWFDKSDLDGLPIDKTEIEGVQDVLNRFG